MSRSTRAARTRRVAHDPSVVRRSPAQVRPGRPSPQPTRRSDQRHRRVMRTLRAGSAGASTDRMIWRPVPAAVPRTRGQGGRRRWWARAVGLVAGLALVAFGTAVSAHAETVQVVALAATFKDVLNNIRNWILGILAALATVFLTIGGVRYVLAAGDPSEIEKAKTCFKTAGIGYGLAALAPLVVDVLKQIVGA
jgi:type IV secretion system pilin